MHSIRRLTAEDAIRRPWKNGRGETAEIVCWPPESAFARGDFDWRLSRAAVVEDGPFSPFPGFDRVLVLLDGDGLRIEHGPDAAGVTLGTLEPYVFRGEWPTTARLLGGPVNDFNLMLARGRSVGAVRVLRDCSAPITPHAAHTLLHVVRGALTVRIGAIDHRLAPFETLWSSGPSPTPWNISADPHSTALLVEIN